MTWVLFWQILSALHVVLVAAAIVDVLRRPREPRAMLAWLLTLVFLPLIGLVLYLMAGEPRRERTKRQREQRRRLVQTALSRQIRVLESHYGQQSADSIPGVSGLMKLATRVSNRAPTTGNDVTIYYEDEQNFDAIMAAIEGAKHHIHLEYYIIQPDETGRALRDLLVKRAGEGVQVRVLVDHLGNFRWPRSFTRSFRDGGVKLAFFLPIIPWRGRWRVNYRNHRKIVVIDGSIGFTGSQNIGDEYLGKLAKFSPWRDTHLRVTGPAVQQLQEIFIEDWHYTTREDLTDDVYFPQVSPAGKQSVQVIASGPDTNARIMHHLLLSAVAGASRSVAIITPYFAPDTTMIVALQSAAYRDVKVQLLVPSQTNHRLTLWAGRSFYEELSSAGVQIFEYEKAMLHSKVVIIDQAWALVGSANMDQRSFRTNFEVTTILYDDELASQLQQDFNRLRGDAKFVRPAGSDHWALHESLLLGFARLASPLL